MAQRPHAEKGDICPLHKKDVSKVCHTCPLYVAVRGMDNNTGKEVDMWSCSLGLLPMLMIENTNMQRQTGAAVESFRNETVRANAMMLKINQAILTKPVVSVVDPKLIEG